MTTLVDVFNLLKGRKQQIDTTVDNAVNPPAPPPAPVQPSTPNGTGAAQNQQYLQAKKALDEMTPQQMAALRARLEKERLAKIAAAQAAAAQQQPIQ